MPQCVRRICQPVFPPATHRRFATGISPSRRQLQRFWGTSSSCSYFGITGHHRPVHFPAFRLVEPATLYLTLAVCVNTFRFCAPIDRVVVLGIKITPFLQALVSISGTFLEPTADRLTHCDHDVAVGAFHCFAPGQKCLVTPLPFLLADTPAFRDYLGVVLGLFAVGTYPARYDVPKQ